MNKDYQIYYWAHMLDEAFFNEINNRPINESKQVGNGRKYPAAILTTPGESPGTFNGKPLSQIKSLTRQPIEYKFFTEKGSEYILSKTGECRRIKCEIHGSREAGLHPWKDKAFFIDPSGGDVIESEFDDIIRQAFQKNDVIRTNSYPIISYKLVDKNLYLMYYSYFDSKWHMISSAADMFELRKFERAKRAIPVFPKKPVLTGVSERPKIGFHVVELSLDNGYVITEYHPGHPVSHIEPAVERSAVKGSIDEMMEKCRKLVGDMTKCELKFNINGQLTGFGRHPISKIFEVILSKHDEDFNFMKCFQIQGHAVKKMSEPYLKTIDGRKTLIMDIILE